MLTLIIYLLLTFPTKLFVEQKLKFENYVAKFHFRNRLLLGFCFHFLKQWNKNLRHGKCMWEVSPVALFTCMSLSKSMCYPGMFAPTLVFPAPRTPGNILSSSFQYQVCYFYLNVLGVHSYYV